MNASMLTERIQLWGRDLVDDVDGDLCERWTHKATIWADVRLKGVDGEALVLDVRARPTDYKFQRIYWHGMWADCQKSVFLDRNYLRFFAKTRFDLT